MGIRRIAQLFVECSCHTRLDSFTMVGVADDATLYVEAFCPKCLKRIQRVISRKEFLSLAYSVLPRARRDRRNVSGQVDYFSEEDEKFLKAIGVRWEGGLP